ncbi:MULTISPECIES: shikimate dehydrogenase [unclassified Massilia]|uniref:shikimate dehydrogenase n=1 Tax=unclassified Massilia TaxID=2609279 RepID=UPI00177F5689|nr:MULTISPECIES: shikimate dehydrogenase [unclassified Massilia]MBD8530842.1 shikimate dehydrogenase [Massilia sp. CFBP 13647]MBD8674542.1 shikimate dehydrogenase [Massilia sp. CFBP 13721]
MTDQYCVIGNPIAHSKSPEIHPVFAAQTGQDLAYGRCLAPLDGFAATVRDLVAQGYKGANVTVPFKIEAVAVATQLTERARAAGAVNTLSFRDGEIIGDNTDGPGLVADILRNAGVTLADKRILLLGAGGAARGIMLPFIEQGPRSILVANRTRATAESLVARFSGHDVELAVGGYDDIAGPYDIVVNATSSSLAAEMPPVPASAFAEGTLALDIMYGSAPSPFMVFASAQGAGTRDGLGMLVEQAAEAFLVWRGVRPETRAVFTKLRP